MSDPIEAEEVEPTLASMILRAITGRVGEVHTAAPGIVQSWNPTTGTAAVKMALNQNYLLNDNTRQTVPGPVLHDVPVWYPRGGGFHQAWPLTAGDEVLLIFAERSIDEWLVKGGQVTPRPGHMHDTSDAIALAGLNNATRPIPGMNATEMTIGTDDGTVDIRLNLATGAVSIKAATVTLAGPAGHPVGRVGDKIQILPADNPLLYAWIVAVSQAGVASVQPFTGPIVGAILTGSDKVTAE